MVHDPGLETAMPVIAGSLDRMAEARQIKIDADLIDQAREAMSLPPAASDAEIVQRAMRTYLGRKAMHEAQARSGLSEEQALDLAYSELHAMRRERRRAA
jgi:Arc/MetJ family transcription regulator